MASSSNVNTSSPREKYPHSTEYDVLDFVPKLLSEGNYDSWKSSMWDFIDSQGLIGFIDGSAADQPEQSKRDDYMAWKRSDNLVRRWMLATLSEETPAYECCASKLPKICGLNWRKHLMQPEHYGNVLAFQCFTHEEGKYGQGHYLALQKAAINGDWDKAREIIEREPDAVRTHITPLSQTALIVAIPSASEGRSRFVRKLLKKMTPEDVKLVDYLGRTALHRAATVNNMEGAKMLVRKNPDLPNVFDSRRMTALHRAAYYGLREMVLYLKGVTRVDILLADDVGSSLLCLLTRGELYDIALTLLQQKPELACIEPNPFDIIVEKHSSFQSGNSFNFWQRLIYLGVPIKLEDTANHQIEGGRRGDIENPANCCISVRQRLHFMIWKVAKKLGKDWYCVQICIPFNFINAIYRLVFIETTLFHSQKMRDDFTVRHVKHIQEKKERQHHALEFVKFLGMEVAKSNLSNVERILKPAVRKAACFGIPEIIEEIILAYPSALYFINLDKLNIFKYAILHRRERVFNLIYQVDAGWRYITKVDYSLNNGLHLAARFGREQQINLKANVAGAVLQMQREVQWFKEVEKFTAPGDKEKRNTDGMTPAEVFSDTHQDLVKAGEQWMKDTATSCTTVATLIATMVFAAAITVPGGNNSNNGQPLLSERNAFAIFGIFDALALFSCITYVFMFLPILTSRYAEEDFLFTLPTRLITGLLALFVSMLSTLVAFGAILYLVFGDNKAWILIPIVALASIPVTLFGALQFPFLVKMIQSTYGQSIFGKKSDRVLR
ncbi:hypothetical protein RHSIM_Rhsim03G0046600 [Rhododendron simsii]|uniref:PGG domain-containing protein n=1 Tax=Rhododendron simsii TaxID=118357 RepID=A0A834H8K3_RHOSS|nr:hypothetical protein RHSIM_Rhsim03G0046600 [Rhododendron simsii]